MSNDLTIAVPVLYRWYHVPDLVKSFQRATPKARLLFVATSTDTDMIDHLQDNKLEYVSIKPNLYGDYAKKINYAFTLCDTEFFFTGASDLYFHPNWYTFAKETHKQTRKSVIGTNDLGHGDTMTGKLSTHTLIKSDYVRKYGLIDGTPGVLCEEYWHEYVDNELVGTAKYRDEYAHSPRSIVEHLHPAWGKSQWDEMYKNNHARMSMSENIYKERQKLWTQQ